MKLVLSLTTYKSNPKWIKDLNLRAKTTKLRKKIGKNLHDVKFDNNFFDMATKEKIYKLGLFQIKNHCASKGTIKRIIKQLTVWDNRAK